MSPTSPNSAADSCANALPWGEQRARKLVDEVAVRTIEHLQDADLEVTTSMLVDKRAGHRIEADVMTGAVVRIGAGHGIENGQRDIRQLLIIGAMTVVRWADRRGAPPGSWLARMPTRKPRMLVAVALANRAARVAWALITNMEVYQELTPVV